MNIMTALKETQRIWRELARTGGEYKEEVIYDLNLTEALGYCNLCPCCEYTAQFSDGHWEECKFCPVWDEEKSCVLGDGEENPEVMGQYAWWISSNTKRSRKTYAKQIADMAKENYNFLKSLGYSEGH